MVKPAKTSVSPRSSSLVCMFLGVWTGVPNVNLFNFRFLLVDFGKMLCSTANELQQNSNHCPRQDYILYYIPQILTVFLQIHCVYI